MDFSQCDRKSSLFINVFTFFICVNKLAPEIKTYIKPSVIYRIMFWKLEKRT